MPEYNGLQTSLVRGPKQGTSNSNAYDDSPASKLNISQGDLTRKLALGTSGTNNTLGTFNLDALLQR